MSQTAMSLAVPSLSPQCAPNRSRGTTGMGVSRTTDITLGSCAHINARKRHGILCCWVPEYESPSSSHTIFIDDVDTSRIRYQTIQLGPYRGKGFIPYSSVSTDDKAGPIYDGTLSATVVGDVSAAVTFTGTRVAVYGSLRPPLQTDVPLPLTKYSIPEWDYGGVPAMVPYQAPNVTSPQNDVNFFTSDILPYGTYTLTINVTAANPSAPFYLDYIAVVVPGIAPASSTSLSASAQSTAASTSAHLPIESLIPQHHRLAGPFVGGVLALVVAFVVFLCYFKQKRHVMLPEYNDIKRTVAQEGAGFHIVPFTDSETDGSMAQPDDLEFVLVPERLSIESQPSSCSPPDSPAPGAAYCHYFATNPAVTGCTRSLTRGQRVRYIASGNPTNSRCGTTLKDGA